MGRGKQLTESERVEIRVLHDVGKSERYISNKIGRSRSAVHNYLNLGDEYGKNYFTKGNRKLTERDEREIVKLADTGQHSVREIQRELTTELSSQTVWRVLQDSPFLSWQKNWSSLLSQNSTRPSDLILQRCIWVGVTRTGKKSYSQMRKNGIWTGRTEIPTIGTICAKAPEFFLKDSRVTYFHFIS